MDESFEGVARLIVADVDPAVDRTRPLRFRTEFVTPGEIASACLVITACGTYRAEINGQPVGDHVMDPGWTSFRHRHRVHTFDVTALVQPGANAIGIEVAEGWYRGRLGFWQGVTDIYGSEIGPYAALHVVAPDGAVTTIATDDRWAWALSPTLSASLYDGETYDQRLEDPTWSRPGGGGRSQWSPVRVAPFDDSVLFAADSPPIRRIEELAPVSIGRSPVGRTLVDFGQNISGRVRVRLPAVADCKITLRPAEVLDRGEIGVRPLRNAKATDVVHTSGDRGWWEPSFTMHGFRYAEVTGWPGEPTVEDLRAVACHTEMVETGSFSCSNELLNRLHENVRWSTKGNFVDVPTDCPQRDERLGWTGDIQVFAPTASFLFDCRSMLASWLVDLAHDQAQFGMVPVWVPFFTGLLPTGPTPMPMAGWGDAAVVVPWVLYERFGDVETLARQYPSMVAWVDQVARWTGPEHHWPDEFQLGDWLDPSAPHDNPAKTRTDPLLVATAYHSYVAGLLADAAAVLGHEDDAARYRTLAGDVAAAFRDEYVSANGRLVSDSPTAYALALMFDLLASAEQRDHAGRRLRALVAADGFHIGTGFLGTPLICDALLRAGDPDAVYHLLTQTECPSWLYPVTMGATTTWERWDSMLPDGSINPGEMTSFNHYALGAVADFLHRRVAGLAPGAPGYRLLDVRPVPGGGLTEASASLLTAHGRAAVSWRRVADAFDLRVVVPAGCEAEVALPDGSPARRVGAGEHDFTCHFRSAADDPPRPQPRSPFGD